MSYFDYGKAESVLGTKGNESNIGTFQAPLNEFFFGFFYVYLNTSIVSQDSLTIGSIGQDVITSHLLDVGVSQV